MAVPRLYLEVAFPTDEAQDTIAVTGEQYTATLSSTIVLPASAVKKEVSLVALITAMNNSATLQKIDVQVEAKPAGGSWAPHFTQDDVIGLPAVEGATANLPAISDITSYVPTYGSVEYRCSINQSAASSVIYTIQYVLVYKYSIKLG